MTFFIFFNKTFLVVGVANRKSVAYFISKLLIEEGAKVILSVKSEDMLNTVSKLFPDSEKIICDVEKEEDLNNLAETIKNKYEKIDGFVHSIAFANYSEGFNPFHETKKQDFLQCVDISCFSFINLANKLKDALNEYASCITISISTTRMASENYGYMAPIKAALDSAICFLAQSFSKFSHIRFNSVNPGLLKTSSSAGIPDYIDSYLFAEAITLRKEAVKTQEVANTAAFLLSERSAGINAQGIVIDAGMSVNYFDKDIVKKVAE